MKTVFDAVFCLSCCSVVPIIVLSALRFARGKVPTWYFMAGWIIIFCLLTLPRRLPMPESKESLYVQTARPDVIYHSGDYSDFSAALPSSDVSVSSGGDADIIPYVWLAGAAVLAVAKIYKGRRLKKYISRSVRLSENIYFSDCFDTAFVYGFFSPKIILPQSADGAALQQMLAHEKSHIERKDHIVKTVCYYILALHWFNPFVWLAYKFMSRDMELACDEKVVRRYTAEEKKLYCRRLLAQAVKLSGLKMKGNVNFLEDDCTMRIKNILKSSKQTATARILAVVLILAVSVSALAADKRPDNVNDFISQSLESVSGRQTADGSEGGYTAGSDTTGSVSDSSAQSAVLQGDGENSDSQIQPESSDQNTECILSATDYLDKLRRGEEEIGAAQLLSGTGLVSRAYCDEHTGIDIASKNGTPIKAAADGVVIKAERNAAGNGIYCIVDHGNGYATLYSHCSDLLVAEGDKVEKGQEIALVGSTGNSTGPHLHFELQKNSEPVKISYK